MMVSDCWHTQLLSNFINSQHAWFLRSFGEKLTQFGMISCPGHFVGKIVGIYVANLGDGKQFPPGCSHEEILLLRKLEDFFPSRFCHWPDRSFSQRVLRGASRYPVYLFVKMRFEFSDPAFCISFGRRDTDRDRISIVALTPDLIFFELK